MSNQLLAVRVPAESLDAIVGSLLEGERQIVMMIALTENLVTLTSTVAGDEAGKLMESMIRQLGEAAVAGAAEHFGVTQAQFNPLIAKADQILTVTRKAAEAAAEEQHDVTH